eukprot:2672153-Rhodomonas_salina.1
MVEIPLVDCICIRASDHEFAPFIQKVCLPETAPSLRPVIAAMLAWEGDFLEFGDFTSQSTMNIVCEQTMGAFKDKLYNAFTPWAAAHTNAGLATISLFDYLGVLTGRDSDQCVSYQTNPAVAVIIPNPIDYFRVCGNTTSCRVKCLPYHQALENEINSRNGEATHLPISFQTEIESNMFQQYGWTDSQDAYVRLISMQELNPEHSDCLCATPGIDCVGVVGVAYLTLGEPNKKLSVRTYCIPRGLQTKVYMAKE